ncbi:MAG: hypothetical protein KDD56_08760 [Bdellovibrionales bacterium]|nr:hypothetical protein [Bdellovibrionales bacterium]
MQKATDLPIDFKLISDLAEKLELIFNTNLKSKIDITKAFAEFTKANRAYKKNRLEISL